MTFKQRMGKSMRTPIALILVLLLAGCANIPPQAIELNKKVSVGVSALEENALEMVTAWEKSGYQTLDEFWTKIYDKAESQYRAKKNIALGTALSSDQTKDVAGLAALIRDEVRGRIAEEAQSYRSIIQKNALEISKANDSITTLLEESNRAIGKRQVVMDQIQDLLPIPSGITTFIETTLSNL